MLTLLALILAQAAPAENTGEFSWKVVTVFVGALVAGDKLVTIIQRMAGKGGTRIEPNPLQVEAAPKFVPVSEMTRIDHEQELLRNQLAAVEKSLREEIRRDVSTLHEKINGLSREVSASTAEQKVTNQTLIGLSAKLDRMAERSHE